MKTKNITPTDSVNIPHGQTEEERENVCIALAMSEAEKRLREGTASNQVICHFLKLGSSKERIEKEILQNQKELIAAKTESIQAGKRADIVYEEVIKAMRKYSGYSSEDEDDYECD